MVSSIQAPKDRVERRFSDYMPSTFMEPGSDNKYGTRGGLENVAVLFVVSSEAWTVYFSPPDTILGMCIVHMHERGSWVRERGFTPHGR
jgi:hypothetical protein